MKILIAPDSFKGSLTSWEVATCLRDGFEEIFPAIRTKLLPLSDGGDGFVAVMHHILGGTIHTKEVKNPIFKTGKAGYLIVKDTAYIEMAQAAGILLLDDKDKNPLVTTTFGVGELIKDAIEKKVKKIVIGIGGSATNDAGMGMANALGYRFLDQSGVELLPIGKNLSLVEKIDDTNLCFEKTELEVTVFCDVKNPLYGANGAAFQYARQKGATPEDVVLLDDGLRHFAKILTDKYHHDFSKMAGAGAAGGLGAGIVAFLGGELISGIDEILRLTQFEKIVGDFDLVVTGEGKIDRQSLSGKLISGITRKAKQKGVPVIAFCGRMELDEKEKEQLGLKAVFPLQTGISQSPGDFSTAGQALKRLAATVIRDLFA